MISTIYDGGQPFGNPCGLQGLSFIEFTSSQPLDLALALHRSGLDCKGYTYNRSMLWYGAGNVAILINQSNPSLLEQKQPTRISAMGWQVSNVDRALQEALQRGARSVAATEANLDLPAVYGTDNSLIYFMDAASADRFYQESFIEYPEPGKHQLGSVSAVGQVNQQVPHGHLQDWVKFYQSTFSFYMPKPHSVMALPERLKSATLVSPDGQITLCLTEQSFEVGNGKQEQPSGDSITLLQGAGFPERIFPGMEERQLWPDEILIQPVKPVYANASLIA